MSLDTNWDVVDECKVVPWYTGWSIFNQDDYKRCVCWAYDPDNTQCLDGVISTDKPQISTN